MDASRGPAYWRSLEEAAGGEGLRQLLGREFPAESLPAPEEVTRRDFLRLGAASLALAGLAGCTRTPEEKIVPYVAPPEEVVPGRPLFFATAFSWGGYARGVLVESHLGRPTKVEGNPEHPSSLGATDAQAQAAVLDLWDPDRAQTVRQAGAISTWGDFLSAWQEGETRRRQAEGRGLRLLTGAVTSPTLVAQIEKLLERYPQARWHHWEPAGRDSARRGARLALNRPLDPVYSFERAERVLSLDEDFLLGDPGSLRYAREFAGRRRVRAPLDREGRPAGPGQLSMNRLYMVESTPTITGAAADHRLRARAGEVEGLALELARLLGLQLPGESRPLTEERRRWLTATAEDLRSHRGASLIVPGGQQTPLVHALAHAMNEALGNAGRTIAWIDPVESHPAAALDSLRELVQAMAAGEVEELVVLGANPVYTAPGDLDFLGALGKVALRVHQSLDYNETSFHCHWHIPETHPLESWSDLRGHDGTASVVQPLIAPLYQGRSAHQLLAAFLGETGSDLQEPVRTFWRAFSRERAPAGEFEPFWEACLRRGVVEGSAFPPRQAQVDMAAVAGAAREAAPPREEGLEVIFRPDPSVLDGRWAGNGWLQELPKPLTKLTWDNAALVSPATARELGLKPEDRVALRHRGRQVEAPVWILPGQPDGSVTCHLGYGRERAGRLGTGTGFNAYLLRTSTGLHFEQGLALERTGKRWPLACTQHHQLLDGPAEELVRVETIQNFARRQAERTAAPAQTHSGHATHSLYPPYDYSGHRWAMQIDNNSCIGCNACVAACQAENNIPMVGKSEVLRSRQMHWLRIDTYRSGDPEESPHTFFEPIPCMHCEKAPCEPVCPVAATTHSAEGLNEMTYNRCVGTRYCSNNCPYKVRRFNFFEYSAALPGRDLGTNPDVTVRARGVIEKCTYCVQRLNHTRIEIKKLELEHAAAASEEERARKRELMDRTMGGLQTACVQACPTQAIAFGDLNWQFQTPPAGGGARPENPRMENTVNLLRMQPQDYSLLTELNTEPRTRYLPRFRNPNPALEPA